MSKAGFKKAIRKAHTKLMRWAQANHIRYITSYDKKREEEEREEAKKEKMRKGGKCHFVEY